MSKVTREESESETQDKKKKYQISEDEAFMRRFGSEARLAGMTMNEYAVEAIRLKMDADEKNRQQPK